MGHHHDIVRGHRDIEFDRVHADRQRAGKSGQRVLRKEPARPAMAVQFDGSVHAVPA